MKEECLLTVAQEVPVAPSAGHQDGEQLFRPGRRLVETKSQSCVRHLEDSHSGGFLPSHLGQDSAMECAGCSLFPERTAQEFSAIREGGR